MGATTTLDKERSLPCWGEHQKFDSTARRIHDAIKSRCDGCWFRADCADLAAQISRTSSAPVPNGTWGGQLWHEGHLQPATPPSTAAAEVVEIPVQRPPRGPKMNICLCKAEVAHPHHYCSETCRLEGLRLSKARYEQKRRRVA